MKNRSRAYYRYQRWRSICRKYRIHKQTLGKQFVERCYSPGGEKGTAIGSLSKGKIHCSCPMCRTKSYDKPSYRDKRLMLNAREQLREYTEGIII